MKKRIQTTQKQLRAYEAEVRRLLEAVGLIEWRVDFELAHLPGGYAEAAWSSDESVCTFRLARSIEARDAPLDPKRRARHEVGHLILARLQDLAHQRYVRHREIGAEAERTARVLERLLP